jgi:hypothetical protein
MLLTFTAAAILAIVGIAPPVARSASDGSTVGSATIQAFDRVLVTPGVMTPDASRTIYHEHGRQMEMIWVSSDARLSGDVICAGNREVNRDGSFVESETFIVTNDGGRWVGQSMGLAAADPAPDIVVGNGLLPFGPDHEDLVLLQGEGGYAGLSAIVHADWNVEPPVITATVFAGELPQAPDLATIG